MFAYLENQGSLDFVPSTSEELTGGRWMTMDIGDVDGDDDFDVVLGGGYLSVGLFAYSDLAEQLSETGDPVLILKNTLN